MTDRDVFAAAAQPADQGLGTGNTPARVVQSAEQPFCERPVAGSTPAAGREPVAWGVLRVGGSWVSILANEVQAETSRQSWDRRENWVHEVVPLYRAPQPTLADEEREAVEKSDNEIFRLRSKLRLQDAVIRSGAVLLLTDEEREAINVAQNVLAGTQTAKTLARVLERTEDIAHTLTDEEREAIRGAIGAEHQRGAWQWADTLRKLLERVQ